MERGRSMRGVMHVRQTARGNRWGGVMVVRVLGLIILLLPPATPRAAGSGWDGGGSLNNWSDAFNWNPNIVPLSTQDQSLTFAGVTRLNTNNDLAGTFTLNALGFDANAGAFLIS